MKVYRVRAVWEVRRAIYNFYRWASGNHLRMPAYNTWGWAIQSGTAAKEDHPGYIG